MDVGFSSAGYSFDGHAASVAYGAGQPALSSPPPRDGKLSDAELAVALISAEPTAPRVALDRFAPMVRGILRRGLGTDADVEDAFQEVFLCVFRRVSALRDPHSLRAFVLGITFNTLYHERRRRQKRARVTCDDELVAASLVSSPNEAAASYALLRLGKLMARLDERERRTFALRVFEGRTALESAKVLGVSEPTVRRAFAYAWSRIRTWAARDPFLLDYFVDGMAPQDTP